MRAAGALLLGAFIIGPAQAQTAGSTTTGTPPASGLACGALKAATSRTGATSSWTISTPSEKTTESGSLRSGPRFECIDGAILVVEFTSSAGHSFFGAYFPDGMNIGYGRQQIERRGTRFVLPVQAKARIPEPYRASFDYHCRLNMPADPIGSTARADCIF
ncbi:MAG: hypothetical protein HQ465_20840 [Rhodospirillales bacterium]|jgi:hypothetical protein|nr:hypothetical protein [Rhodospirillales bacterium]